MPLIKDLSDTELSNEWNLWNDKINNTKRWGSSLAAASEFRKECETEIKRRKIIVSGFNDETYYFARATGDRAFILWLRDRLVLVYGEDPNIDFVQTLERFADVGKFIRDHEKIREYLKDELDKLAAEK